MWSEQKRFCMQYLRKRGFGGDEMEKLVKDEVNDLILEIMNKSEVRTRLIRVNMTNICIFSLVFFFFLGRYPIG